MLKKGAISLITVVMILLSMISIIYINSFWKVSEKVIEAQGTIDTSLKSLLSESIFFPMLESDELWLYKGDDIYGYIPISATTTSCFTADEAHTKYIMDNIKSYKEAANGITYLEEDKIHQLSSSQGASNSVRGILQNNYGNMIFNAKYTGGLTYTYTDYSSIDPAHNTGILGSISSQLRIDESDLAYFNANIFGPVNKRYLQVETVIYITVPVNTTLPGAEQMFKGFGIPEEDLIDTSSYPVKKTSQGMKIPIYSSFKYNFY